MTSTIFFNSGSPLQLDSDHFGFMLKGNFEVVDTATQYPCNNSSTDMVRGKLQLDIEQSAVLYITHLVLKKNLVFHRVTCHVTPGQLTCHVTM